MNRATVTVFGVNSVEDYLKFCHEAVREFEADQGNVMRGFAAILALNHVPDWLQHKLTSTEASKLGLPELGKVKENFEAKNPDVKLIRQLANGVKHLKKPTTARETSRVSGGFGEGPFGVGPFSSAYLLIELPPGPTSGPPFVDAYSLCQEVLDWWQQQLEQIIP